MSVEDVSIPKAKQVAPLTGAKEKGEGEPGYFERKAEEIAARVKYETEMKELERIRAGGAEPGFQIKGGIDLGIINLQEQQRQAAEEREKVRKEAEAQLTQAGAVNEELRQRLHQADIKMLETTLNGQIQNLTNMIANLTTTSKKSFMEQYQEAMEIGKVLGLGAPSVATSDLNTTLALKKMEFDQAVALRQMDREDKRAAKQQELDMEKLKDERLARQERLQLDKDKNAQLGSGIEALGRVIVKATAERAAGISGAPKTGAALEADIGASGETTCPCGGIMGIGPTATKAVCPNCGTTYPINRVEAPAPPPPPPAPPPAPKPEEE